MTDVRQLQRDPVAPRAHMHGTCAGSTLPPRLREPDTLDVVQGELRNRTFPTIYDETEIGERVLSSRQRQGNGKGRRRRPQNLFPGQWERRYTLHRHFQFTPPARTVTRHESMCTGSAALSNCAR